MDVCVEVELEMDLADARLLCQLLSEPFLAKLEGMMKPDHKRRLWDMGVKLEKELYPEKYPDSK